VKDYDFLSQACKRAGKVKDEGRAYYSAGVLLDNVGRFKQSISRYLKFLEVCKAIGDKEGEALAYNALGVAYQKMGEAGQENYVKAMEFHKKHLEIADVSGQFMASINLGLISEALKDSEGA